MPNANVESCLADHVDSEEFADRFDFDGMIECPNEQNQTISTWIDEIAKEAADTVAEMDDGDRDNLLENKPFAKYFISLCQMIPIWSAISNKFFNSPNLTGSSWSSETGFKNMKQLHGDKIPCSVDEFVKRDLEFNNSTVIEASKKYLTKTALNPKTASNPNTRSTSNTRSKSNTRLKSKEKKNTGTTLEPELVQDSQEKLNANDDVDEQQIDNASNEIVENAVTPNEIACPVCADENLPSGAHKCFQCNKSVHILVECSISIGDDEGYGEMRQCIACFRSTANKESTQSEALNEEETWMGGKKNTKPSKYMKSVPNWGLAPVNKRVGIPPLLNENLSRTVYTINKKKINLTNTCAIDSLIHLIAGAYAYHPAYRLSQVANDEPILEISRMLANG